MLLANARIQLTDYLAGLPDRLRPADQAARRRSAAPRLGPADHHPLRRDRHVRRARGGTRRRHHRPGGRAGRRPQSAEHRRPVPSRGRQERPTDRLRGRAGAQAIPARTRRAGRGQGGEVVLMAPTKWQKRVDSGDWDAITAEVNDFGGALLPRLLTEAETDEDPRALSGRRPVPRDDRHAQIPVRRGRIPLLPAALSRADRGAQAGAVSATAADRAGLVDQTGPQGAVAGHPRRLARHVPPGRADQVDRHSAQVRRGRLERPASRPVRGLGVSATGRRST